MFSLHSQITPAVALHLQANLHVCFGSPLSHFPNSLLRFIFPNSCLHFRSRLFPQQSPSLRVPLKPFPQQSSSLRVPPKSFPQQSSSLWVPLKSFPQTVLKTKDNTQVVVNSWQVCCQQLGHLWSWDRAWCLKIDISIQIQLQLYQAGYTQICRSYFPFLYNWFVGKIRWWSCKSNLNLTVMWSRFWFFYYYIIMIPKFILFKRNTIKI